MTNREEIAAKFIKRPRKLSIVKYDYDSLPDEWKSLNKNINEGKQYIYFGEVPNQLGHCVCINMDSGKVTIFDTESVIECTDDELGITITLHS